MFKRDIVNNSKPNYMERNLAMRDEHKIGASYSELGRKYGISPSRVRAIIIHLDDLERWYGTTTPRADCISLKDAALLLGVSYTAIHKLKEKLPKVHHVYGARQWIHKADLARWLKTRSIVMRNQADHYDKLAAELCV